MAKPEPIPSFIIDRYRDRIRTSGGVLAEGVWYVSVQLHGTCPACEKKGEMRRDVHKGVSVWSCWHCGAEHTHEAIMSLYPIPYIGEVRIKGE